MQKLTEDDRFNNFIIGIIMLAGLVVGLQTDKYCETLPGVNTLIMSS